MRFQDAAKDARAVVYAGIQADPLVGRLASLLADATTAERWLGRAVMNGERTDAQTWRVMFPALFGDGPAGGTGRAEAILAASLEVANRGEAARSQYRGAVVEELTQHLLARRSGAGSPIKRERRVLFDGVRAEIHPYDVTVEFGGAARGLRLQVGRAGHQRRRPESARRRAVACRGRGCRASRGARHLRRPPIVRAQAGPRHGQPERNAAGFPGRSGLARGTGEVIGREAGAEPQSDIGERLPYRIVRPYRVRFEESTARETMRTAIFLAWAADVAWQHSALLGFDRSWYSDRGLFWLVRAVRLEVLAPIHTYDAVTVSTQVLGFRRIAARRRSDVRDAAGNLLAWLEIDWVMTNERGIPTRIPDEMLDFVDGGATFEMLKICLPDTPAEAARTEHPSPWPRPGSAGPREQQRLCRLPRGDASRRRPIRSAGGHSTPLRGRFRGGRGARRYRHRRNVAARGRLGLPTDPGGRHGTIQGPRRPNLGVAQASGVTSVGPSPSDFSASSGSCV